MIQGSHECDLMNCTQQSLVQDDHLLFESFGTTSKVVVVLVVVVLVVVGFDRTTDTSLTTFSSNYHH